MNKNYIIKDLLLKNYLDVINIEPLKEVVESKKHPVENEINKFSKRIEDIYHFENYTIDIFVNNRGCISCSNCILKINKINFYLGDDLIYSARECSILKNNETICYLIGLDEHEEYNLKFRKGEFSNVIRIDFNKKRKRYKV